MIRSSKAIKKLNLLIFILCSIIVTIGVLGINETKIMNEHVKSLYSQRLVTLKLLNSLESQYIFIQSTLKKEATTGVPGANKTIEIVESAKKIIDISWKEYSKALVVTPETELLSRAGDLKQRADIQIDNSLEQIKEGHTLSSMQADELGRVITPLISSLSSIADLQMVAGKDIKEKNEFALAASTNRLYVLIIAALFLAIGFSYLTTRSINRLITQLKHSNRAIAASEQRLKTFLEFAGDAMFVMDENFVLTDVNDSACKLLGYTRNELQGSLISHFVAPIDVEDHKKKIALLNKVGGSIHQRIFKRKNNSSVETEVNVQKIEGLGYISIARDVTDRKKLEEQQLLMTFIVNSNYDAIISKSLDGTITSWNKAAENTFGYEASEVIGRNIAIIIPPELLPEEERLMRRIELKEHTTNYETYRIRRDGTRVWVSFTMSPIINAAGKVIGSAKIMHDITEQKRIQKELQHSNDKYFSFFEQASDGIMVVDADGNIEEANSAICDLLMYKRDEMLTKTLDDLIDPETEERDLISFNLVVRGQIVRRDKHLLKKDGSLAEVELKVNKINADKFMILSRDISERKTTEMALRESEEKFRNLVEQELVGVYIYQDEHFAYVNPALSKLAGYSPEELSEMSFAGLVHEDDLEKINSKYAASISGTSGSYQCTVRVINSNGEVLYIEMIASAISYMGKQAIIGSAMDITSKMEEERRIDKAVIDAQENERMEIGMELHDNVKQMLTACNITLDFAKNKLERHDSKELPSLIDKVKVYTSEAIDEWKRLSHQLAPSMDSSVSLYEKVMRLAETLAISKNIKFDIKFGEPDVPLCAERQLAFYRIVQEQLNNIVKYAEADRVKIRLSSGDYKLTLCIKDNGKGFDTTRRKSGIGLENIRRRAQMLGGHSRVISSPGKGCEVCVTVPLKIG